MDERKFQMMLMGMVKNIGQLVRMHFPEVNHVSMFTIGDNIVNIRAFRDEEGNESETIFEAHIFEDGHMHIGNAYYKADGSLDFVVSDEREEETA